MMINGTGIIIILMILSGLGTVFAFILFAFRLWPFWAVPAAAFATPIAFVAILPLVMILSWLGRRWS